MILWDKKVWENIISMEFIEYIFPISITIIIYLLISYLFKNYKLSTRNKIPYRLLFIDIKEITPNLIITLFLFMIIHLYIKQYNSHKGFKENRIFLTI